MRGPVGARTPSSASLLGIVLIGAFLIAAWPQLTHLYWMDRAGALLDRAIVDDDDAALREAGAIFGLYDTPTGRDPRLSFPEPGSRADSAGYWRTYGALAARLPSEEGFATMWAARERGALDRMGRLWLAEIAASTGHWDVAAEEYGRVEAVNLLLDRGDDALDSGLKETARRWYESAARGLLAGELPSRSGLTEDPETGDIFDAGAGRTILLLRVAQGLLKTGPPAEALPALERAESEIQAYPPGIGREQAVRFTLARVLALTMPTDAATPEELAESEERRRRIGTLLDHAVSAEESGWARLQEAYVRLEMGDRTGALKALGSARRLDPALTEARLAEGLLLEQDGLHSLARDIYAEGLDSSPDDDALLTAWAKAVYSTQDAGSALPALQAAAGTDAADPAVFALLGDCLRGLGDLPGARAAYGEGLRRSPGNVPLQIRRARLPQPTGEIP